MRILVLLATLTMGCLGGYNPHELILVVPDHDVEGTIVHGVSGREIVRAACHEWDTVGARFRTIEDIEPGERPTGTLHVRNMIVHLGGVGGSYTWGDDVRVDLSAWPTYWTDKLAVHAVAHELGHSVGLPHSSDCDAMMAGSDHGCPIIKTGGVATSDVAAYRAMWGE